MPHRHAADRHHRRRAWCSPSSSARSPTGCGCRRWSATCSPASLIGPFTPGFVADQELAAAARRDRRHPADVRRRPALLAQGPAVGARASPFPARSAQIARRHRCSASASRWLLGWSLGAGLVFGLALSVASTVVLLRALQERRLIETERGRIAVGWLIVEDLAMVLALVLLPALAGAARRRRERRRRAPASRAGRPRLGARRSPSPRSRPSSSLMLVVGRRVIPWMLHYVAHTGSRELFRLAVLAIALGIAFGSAELFGVSFALGAFFAGMILTESRAQPPGGAGDSLPLRDAFAVLFFVSVGMLFDPTILVDAAAGRCWRRCSSSSSASRSRPSSSCCAFGYPVAHGADHLGEPGADRRVLLHPRRARRRA